MKTVYGVHQGGNVLVKLGACELAHNHLKLSFHDDALARFGTELRPFVFLGDRLAGWPGDQLGAITDWRDHASIWANPLGKRKDHRPKVWCGYPVDDELAVLKSVLDPAKLGEYEPKQDGFLRRLFPE